MKALVLVALVLLAPVAQAAEDAPLATPEQVCIPAAQRIDEAKAFVAADVRAQNLEASLKKSTPLHPALVVGLIVLAAAAGGAGGYAVAKAIK